MASMELNLMGITGVSSMSFCPGSMEDRLFHIFVDNKIDLALTPIYCEKIARVLQRAQDPNVHLYPDMETAAFFICSGIYDKNLNPQLIAVRISVGAISMDKSNFKMIIELDDSLKFMVAATIITKEALSALEENLWGHTSVEFLPSPKLILDKVDTKIEIPGEAENQ